MPLALLALALLAHGAAVGGEIDYLQDIKPVLKSRCYACHGVLKQKAGLRLDTVAAMRKGGKDGGSVITPGKALLLERVSNPDETERMPPEGAPLSAEEIGKLKAWISAGAKGPPDEQPQADPRQHWAYRSPKPFTLPGSPRGEGKQGGLEARATTAGGLEARATADIDALLAARLSAKGLKLQAEAPPEIWLRRVYFDLIGLPPSAEQVRAFQQAAAAGNAASARAQTVDALLSSPQYGERWARHFMDIWRYCDWYGLDDQLRHSQKHIWHWRDWIVESLNAGKGYDRMIVEMLAADEETPADREALRATGFLSRNYFLFNRTTWLDEAIEHTNRAFLGVTMQCAKCHDHKYDPIEQADYYRMRAIFEPYHVRLDAWPGETDFQKNGLPRVFDLHLERATYLHVRGDEKNEDKSRALAPGVPAVLSLADFKPEPVALPASASVPGVQQFVLDDQLALAEREIAKAKEALDKARKSLADLQSKQDKGPLTLPSPPKGEGNKSPQDKPAAVSLAEATAAAATAEKALAAAQAKPAMLRAAFAADQARAEQTAGGGTGVPARPANLPALIESAAKAAADYQLALAELELAKVQQLKKEKDKEKDKKLKAAEEAVAAARKKAAAPGNTYTSLRATLKAQDGPEEKDNAEVQSYPAASTGRRLAFARWLADLRNPLTARVLVNHLWTRHFGASLVPDPTDFGLRCPPPLHQDALDTLAVDFMEHGWDLKRLHKQMVLSRLYRAGSSNARADAATLAADPENIFYWRMNPRRLESQAVRDALLSVAGKLDLKAGGPSIDPKDEASPRRSLYFVQNANVEHRFLGAFDNASVLECYRRQESIVPQQALALANSKLARDCADALAARLAKLEQPAFVEEAFVTLLARTPSPEEARACYESLATLSGVKAPKADPQRARGLFLQALMNHNDFITLR